MIGAVGLIGCAEPDLDGQGLDTGSDGDTDTIRAFNRKAAADPRVETLMLPIRDGLLLARRVQF